MGYFSRNKLPPIGSVVGWLKDFTGTPALPAGWVECNGQALSDTKSPLHGQNMPDINTSGFNFLRGSQTSGSIGGQYCHYHCIYFSYQSTCAGMTDYADCTIYAYSAMNLPPYYEVVYVIRVR
jgi:hypothetical protein